MRELRILLKYGLKGTYQGRNRKRSSQSILLIIVFASVYGFPLSSIFHEIFKKTSSIFINGIDFPTLLISYWSTLSIIMFLTSFFSSLVSSFVKNEEINILLTYPISRASIAIYQMILTFVSQAFVLVMYFSVFIAYSTATGRNIPICLLSLILMSICTFFISLILSASIGLFMKRSTARAMNIVSLLLSVVIFLIATQLLPGLLNTLVESELEKFLRVGQILLSPVNVFAWPILATLEKYEYLVGLIVLTIAAGFVGLKIAYKLTFEQNERQKMNKRLLMIENLDFTKKELKILVRQSQTIMMFFYPTALCLIFSYATKSIPSSIFFTVITSAFYVSSAAALLSAQELQIWPMPRVLPINMRFVVIPKIFLPPTLFALIFTATLFLLQLLFNIPWIFHLLTPLVFILYLYASTLAVDVTFKYGKGTGILNPSRVIPVNRVFEIQIFVMLTSIFIVAPTLLYIGLGEIFKKYLRTDLLINLVGLVLPISTAIFLIFIVHKKTRSIVSRLTQME